MDPKQIDEIRSLIGDPSRVIVNPQIVEQLSKDFYWYSPVLRKQLDGKLGDAVVQPLSAAEIQKLLHYCYANNFAVTARGAGTGNYGQAVPLEGGIVLDLSRMDRIEEILPEGVAVCQPGVRLGDLENEARKAGWELRCYPSTIIKASVGGFLGIFKRCAPSKWSRWSRNRAWYCTRVKRSTKFSTPGAPTASSPAFGWR
jgi:FAD/FMN-containing dehydrogenase